MSAKIIILLSFYFCGATLGCQCPVTWAELNEKCYRVSKGSEVSFAYAERACHQASSELASVHSQAEHNFLVATVQYVLSDKVNKDWNPQVLIGMKIDSVGTKTWTDGSSVDFEAWYQGEPNLRDVDAYVVIAAGGISSGEWADVNEGLHFQYICQKTCA